MGLNEQRFKDLVQQFRKKSTDELWFAMHSGAKLGREYELAGELVLKEREESVARLRSKYALWTAIVSASIAALSVTFTALSYLRGNRQADVPTQIQERSDLTSGQPERSAR